MNACTRAINFFRKGKGISNSIECGLLFHYWFCGRLPMPRI